MHSQCGQQKVRCRNPGFAASLDGLHPDAFSHVVDALANFVLLRLLVLDSDPPPELARFLVSEAVESQCYAECIAADGLAFVGQFFVQ
jgi:hypothetical protein